MVLGSCWKYDRMTAEADVLCSVPAIARSSIGRQHVQYKQLVQIQNKLRRTRGLYHSYPTKIHVRTRPIRSSYRSKALHQTCKKDECTNMLHADYKRSFVFTLAIHVEVRYRA